MSSSDNEVAILAERVPPRKKASAYPEPFRACVAGRTKRKLGDVFGLKNFGVNLTTLAPGSQSALRHAHAVQDEFVYVLEGTATLVSNAGKTTLGPGMCAGFRAGNGDAHHLINEGDVDVLYLEIGDRTPGDDVEYPDDDLKAVLGEDGAWRMLHKDGTPYWLVLLARSALLPNAVRTFGSKD